MSQPQNDTTATRDQAIKLAREAALAHSHQHDYLPQTRQEADRWQPHEWVVLALQSASSADTQSAVLQVPDTDDVRLILGRMCFQCIRIAHVLRLRGDEIKNRAEDEQAAVLRFLLNHYLASPDQWEERAQAEINAFLEWAQATGAEVGA